MDGIPALAALKSDQAATDVRELEKAVRHVELSKDEKAKAGITQETGVDMAGYLQLSEEGMWKSCLEETLKNRHKEIAKMAGDDFEKAKDILFSSPEAMEDLAATYQLMRSRYGGKCSEAEMDRLYKAEAGKMVEKVGESFNKVFNAQFTVLSSYEPDQIPRTVDSPYQKQAPKMDSKEFQERLRTFADAALKAVKECKVTDTGSVVQEKVINELQKIEGDPTKIAGLSYKVLKEIGKTIVDLPDLTKMTEEMDADKVLVAARKWGNTINELAKNCPWISDKIISAMKKTLETFEKTWAYAYGNKMDIKNREKYEQELKDAQNIYDQLRDGRAKAPPTNAKDQEKLAEKIVKYENLIKTLSKLMHINNAEYERIRNSPETITTTQYYAKFAKVQQEVL